MTCLFNHWGITVVVLAVHNFMATQIKAAVLLIGDELLSGRTRDINLQNIAQQVAKNGIDVAEARIIADVPALIAQHVNQLRQQYDLVFTSGGIGPTHDDRTMDAVAMAFETVAEIDPEADQRLREYYAGEGREYTEARRRMARLPVWRPVRTSAMSMCSLVCPKFYWLWSKGCCRTCQPPIG